MRLINPAGRARWRRRFASSPWPRPASRSYPGRAGSDPHRLVRRRRRRTRRSTGSTSFTLQAFVWPTTPGGGRQALLGAWSESPSSAALAWPRRARRARGCGSATAASVARLSTGTPLRARRWYLVAGELRCRERPARAVAGPGRTTKPSTTSDARTVSRARPRSAPPAAACPSCSRPGTQGEAEAPTADRPIWSAGGHYNGKLDRPRLAERALDPAEIAALARRRRLPAGLERGRWSRAGISRSTSRARRMVDTSPNRLHGPDGQSAGARHDRPQLDRRGDGLDAGARAVWRDPLPRRRPGRRQLADRFRARGAGRTCARASMRRASARNEAEFYVPFFVRPPRGAGARPRSPFSPRPRPTSPTSTTAPASPRSRPSSTTAG